MRETEKQVTASNLSSHLIGYERLLALFKDIQKQTPKGVGLKREVKASGTYILYSSQHFSKGKKCDRVEDRS